MTTDKLPQKPIFATANLGTSVNEDDAADYAFEDATSKVCRRVVIFGQSLYRFRYPGLGGQCYTATIATDKETGSPIALDIRAGFALASGSVGCLRKALQSLAGLHLCVPEMSDENPVMDAVVDAEWRENDYFTSVVEALGGHVHMSVPKLKGPEERFLAMVGQYFDSHGHVSPQEAEVLLLAQMRAVWLARKKLAAKTCDAIWQHKSVSTFEAHPTRLHSIAYVGSPLQRCILRDGMVQVLGETYRNELTRALASGRRKKVRQSFYINPWDDSTIYMLDRHRKRFVAVPQARNLLSVLGIPHSQIKVKWPGDMEALGRRSDDHAG